MRSGRNNGPNHGGVDVTGQALLVCSGGGHLKQLHQLADRVGIPVEQQVWVTFDTGLSRSLLAGRETVFATYAAPRDAVNIVRNVRLARNMLTPGRFALAISTGASLAVSFLPIAARRGIDCHFVETAARASGPSLTGKLIARDRRIATYTQYRAWADERWQYRGSIFDQFGPGPAMRRELGDRPRAVVTVGTTESYGFRRLISALVPLLAGWDVLWQTGRTELSGLDIAGRETVPHEELVSAVAAADVVISHAGTGAALTALEAGKCPILVPRLARHAEHVDDHQIQIADELQGRRLAIRCEPHELSEAVLREAAGRAAERAAHPQPFKLGRRGLAA